MLKKSTFFIFSYFLLLTSCGYTLQGINNPLKEKAGIEKIYIAPTENNTYETSIETIVFNHLIKKIASQKRVQIVKNPKHADATLKSSVYLCSYKTEAKTPASKLTGGTGRSDISVATVYLASLGSSFSLIKNDKTIWSRSINKRKSFQANNQLGALGSTSHLINQSEFYKALEDLSSSMMDQVHESMLAMF